MANNNGIKRLIKEVSIMNILNRYSKEGFMTLLIEGLHGEGKSSSIRAASEELGGICITVEGGVLQQGELTGIPLAVKDPVTGDPIFEFIKYPKIADIAYLEKEIFTKATTEGLLGGDLRYIPETSTVIYKGTEIVEKNRFERALLRNNNPYRFGEKLPAEAKMRLINEGEVPLVNLFIDELNRPEEPIIKEMMNLLLNREINGYMLPWWVNVTAAINPASQDIDYAVSRLDPAQLDRFIKVRLHTDFKDWVNHSLNTGHDAAAIAALANDPALFGGSSRYESTEMSPSNRSWSTVLTITETLPEALKAPCFSDDDRSHFDEDFRTLICGKVGASAGEAYINSFNNKETRITPEEIFTCKNPGIDEDVVKKFSKQNTIARLCTISMVVSYLNEIYLKLKADASSSEKEHGKAKFHNLNCQLKSFIMDHLSGGEQMYINNRMKNPEFLDRQIFADTACNVFGKDLWAKICETRDEIKHIERGL